MRCIERGPIDGRCLAALFLRAIIGRVIILPRNGTIMSSIADAPGATFFFRIPVVADVDFVRRVR
jgi:hypothetical protein